MQGRKGWQILRGRSNVRRKEDQNIIKQRWNPESWGGARCDSEYNAKIRRRLRSLQRKLGNILLEKRTDSVSRRSA